VRLRLARLFGREVRVPFAPMLPIWNHPTVTRLVKRALSNGSEFADRVDFSRLAKRSDAALDVAGWRNTDWRAMRSFRIALDGWDVRARVSAIDLPAIILHGTEDTLFPLQAARDLAGMLPNAELRIVEGAGHGLPLTHPEAVRNAVGELGRGTT